MPINLQAIELESNQTVDTLSQIVYNDSTLSLASFYLSIFIIGLLSNFIVIFVFALKKGFYQYSNYFFINLSFSDVLVLLFCVPIAIADLFYPDDWQFGSFYCEDHIKIKVLFFINKFSFYWRQVLLFFGILCDNCVINHSDSYKFGTLLCHLKSI